MCYFLIMITIIFINQSKKTFEERDVSKIKNDKRKSIRKVNVNERIRKLIVSEVSGMISQSAYSSYKKYCPVDNARPSLNLGVIDDVFVGVENSNRLKVLRIKDGFRSLKRDNQMQVLQNIDIKWFLCTLAKLFNHDRLSCDEASLIDMKYIIFNIMNASSLTCDVEIKPFVVALNDNTWDILTEIDFASLASVKCEFKVN